MEWHRPWVNFLREPIIDVPLQGLRRKVQFN